MVEEDEVGLRRMRCGKEEEEVEILRRRWTKKEDVYVMKRR